MVVNRLLDAFFKTLDVVDAARDRVDNALGRQPRPDPWAVDWPAPTDDAEDAAPEAKKASGDDEADASDTSAAAAPVAASDSAVATPAKKPAPAAAKKSDAKKDAPKKDAAKKPAAKKAPKKRAKTDATKKTKKSRKGSVDRAGKDYDSPRADTVAAQMDKAQTPVISEEADYDGKKVLGRVLWALWVAEQAGESDGMTTGDVSALLHLSAKMNVFSTNVGRACRDHADLIAVGKPDGRSKRYILTDAGRTAAATVSTTTDG